MPTLEASFNLYDNYTRNIERINTSTDRAEKKINSASKAVDKLNTQMGKSVSNKATDKLEGSLGKVSSKVDSVNGKAFTLKDRFKQVKPEIDNMGNGLDKAKSPLDSLIGKTLKWSSVVLAAKKALEIVGSGLNMSNELNKSRNVFGGILEDAKMGDALFQHISDQAQRSTLSLKDMATNTQSFLGVTRNIKDLDRLNAMVERMAVLDTTGQGAVGAGFSLKEAMTGDYTSLAERFNISRNSIKNSGLMDAVNTGDMTKALDILDSLLNKAGYSQAALESVTQGLDTQWTMLTSNMSVKWGQAMDRVANTLAPVVIMFNEMLASGKLQPFFNILATGINIVAIGLTGIINGFIWFGEVISNAWNIIWPFLVGIGVALLPMIISAVVTLIGSLWALIPPIIAMATTFIVANMPIILMALLIGGVIIALQRMGVTAQDVFQFIGGVVGVLIGFIYNRSIYLWNVFAALANFVGNVFTNPIAAVKALFYDLMVNALSAVAGIAQGIQDLLNKIPGVSVNLTSSITGLRDKLAQKSQDIKSEAGLIEFVKTKEFMDYSSAYSKGSELGDKAYNWTANTIGGIGDFISGAIPGGGAAGVDLGNMPGFNGDPMEVANGGGKALEVDVSNQDLKYLKDIAEREYINKFSTATLAPNTKIEFTGPINKETDVDLVAEHIRNIMIEEIEMFAEG